MTSDDIELARMTLLEFTGNAKDVSDIVDQALMVHQLAGDLLLEVIRLRTLLVRVQTQAVGIQTEAHELLKLGFEGTGPLDKEKYR